MCGICGIVFDDPTRKAPEGLIGRMTDRLEHRGPDDRGAHEEPGVSLGHSRLSIIDLSTAGRQPMTNEDGSLLIVFNGEIYNFAELREELVKRGHVFSSHTDTEVILHLYEEKGNACLSDLRGMFAFALWDRRRRRLFAARDRAGQKPLVWAPTDGSLIFASELKSLLEVPSFPREVDGSAIHHYLTYQYIPSPRTIFRGARKLPPGHSLTWEKGRVTTERYWSLHYVPKLRLGSLRAYRERFLEIFNEAVQLRMISDVPLGAFLSGGVDSSLVVASMSRASSSPVRTFSIGFSEKDYDEVRYARQVAEMYGTEHKEMVVEPKALEVLPDLVRAYNEPFADSSAVPTYYVSLLTRRHVTVALSGDGGDEAFGGYRRYAVDRFLSWYLLLPGFLREKVLRRLVESLPRTRRPRGFIGQLKRFVASVDPVRERQYVRYLCFFTEEQKEELYTPDFAAATAAEDPVSLIEDLYRRADGTDHLDRTLAVDTGSYLPDDICVKVDIASMSNSLEARSPFLDHHLMEFAASCPSDLKLRGWKGKYLLKKAAAPLLPPAITRRRKMGFGMPVAEWFRRELKEMAGDVLLSDRALQRGYFVREGIESMLREHHDLSRDHGYRLWALLFLELWFREFIDRAND
jgi:asparagine synthase (glutamine-hydrolysing)